MADAKHELPVLYAVFENGEFYGAETSEFAASVSIGNIDGCRSAVVEYRPVKYVRCVQAPDHEDRKDG